MRHDPTITNSESQSSAGVTGSASLPAGSSHSSITMTPLERAMGRLMRAPDHPDGGEGGDDPEPVVDKGGDEQETEEQKAEREAAEAKAREGETDEQKAEREAKEAEEARAVFYGAPAEDAAYEITGLPKDMEIDAKALEAITPIARQLNLSNAGLSLIAKTYAENVLPGVGERFQSDLETKIVAQSRDWEQQTRDAQAGKLELKTAGGAALTFDGKQPKEIEGVVARALDKLAPAGFREFLAESGLGNNPLMNAFAYQVGRLIREDTDFEPGGGDKGRGERKGPAMSDPDRFYK